MIHIRKALRGYLPAAVRQYVVELQDNHRIRMEELNIQADLLAREHEILTAELKRLEDEQARNQPVEVLAQAAANQLFKAHWDQTESVWKVMQELKAENERIVIEAEEKQSERERVLEHAEHALRSTLNAFKERNERE